MEQKNAKPGDQHVDAKIYGIAVENGKNVVCVIVNGSKVTIDTNIIGFATLARHGVPVLSVTK